MSAERTEQNRTEQSEKREEREESEERKKTEARIEDKTSIQSKLAVQEWVDPSQRISRCISRQDICKKTRRFRLSPVFK